MEKVILAAAVVDLDDEVGDVLAVFDAVLVGHGEAEVVVFYVGVYAILLLGDAAELALPLAVKDGPVDVAFVRARLATAAPWRSES